MVNRPAGATPGTIIEVEGTLKEVLPEIFHSRLPLILDDHRNERVKMVVTTKIGRRDEAAAPSESFFRPASAGTPAEFTWQASGALSNVIRQFRLDFLRHLSPEDLRSRVALAIYHDRRSEEHAWPAAPAVTEPPPAPATPVKPTAPRPLLARPDSSYLIFRPGHSFAGSAEESAPLAEPLAPAASAAAEPQPAAEPPQRPPAVIIDATPESVAPENFEPENAVPENVEAEAQPPAEPERQQPADLDPQQPAEPESPAREPASSEPAAPGEDPLLIAAAPPSEEAPRHAPLSVASACELLGNFYQDYYGFEFMPFNNTPDSHFYFPTDKHQEALSRLLYAIAERKGFVLISGEVGAGKSTLCRTLLAQLPREIKTALITHTHLDASQVTQAIAEDLGLLVRGKTRYEILQLLNEYLIEQLSAGCTVCIIIDEAQNLSPAALEEVRMISNLETEQEKLVQLILLGQPELRDKIRLPEMRQLRQRISVQYHLEPINHAETLGYIRHRLKIAHPTQPLEFTRGAMSEVYRYSGGVPRLINSLCDNALLTTYTRQVRTVTRALIREAGRDLDLEPQTSGLGQFFKFW